MRKLPFIEKVKPWLYQYPDIYLRIKALNSGRSLMTGIRLNTYAAGKACLEEFTDLGVGKGLVEVKVLYTALNSGTERANFLGLPNTKYKFPVNPGGSGLGRVIKVGRGVKGLKKGDIVTGAFQHSSQEVLEAHKIAKLDPRLPVETAAFMHVAIIAIQGVRMGQITKESKVVVVGQGIIGRLAALISRGIGAETFVVTRSKDKLEQFNETTGIALEDQFATERLNSLEADVVIDASGNPDVIHDCINSVKAGGIIVLLGSNRGFTKNLKLTKGKRFKIVGAHIRNIEKMPASMGGNYKEEANFLQDLILKGKLDGKELISKSIKAKDLVDYYNNELPKGLDSGVLVEWGDNEELKDQLISTPVFAGLPKYTFKSKLNIAVVGCGASGFEHANAIGVSNGFKLHTVMDVNTELAQKLAQKTGAGWTDNYDTLISNKDIDVVLITSPHFLHKGQAITAAEGKKHVLVDKPLALSQEDAKEVLDAGIENDVLVGTFLQRIFEPTQIFAKQLLELGMVGNILGVSMEYLRDKPMSYWLNNQNGQLNWRAQREKSGGGFLIMNLIHELDYFRYITGMNFSAISATVATLCHPINVEDSVGITFTLENGAIGTIAAGSVTKGHGGQIMRIWGDAGQIVLDTDVVKFYSHKKVGKYGNMRWHEVSFEGNLNTRSVYFDFFRQKLEEGEKTSYTERGYEATKILGAIYESSLKKEVVYIK